MKLSILIGQELKIGPKRPLDKGPQPRQIKLWFNLHSIILDDKPIGLDKIFKS